MVKKLNLEINSPQTNENITETIRNTQATPTDHFGKKLKTGKKQLDPLNGPKEYH
ncbi:MAG: hypothetical protein WCP73_00310 [Eubacteriales bacterium]